MSTIEESIDVEVPIQDAYNQWTQFEEFPDFMEGVESVRQTDDTHLHWVAEVAGVRREWDATITVQHPDERVAWTSTDGVKNAGVVTFYTLSPEVTRVTLQLDMDPEGFVEKMGDALGFIRRRAKGDLERYKFLVESGGGSSQGWRGDVSHGNA